jgi:hypothetical protein
LSAKEIQHVGSAIPLEPGLDGLPFCLLAVLGLRFQAMPEFG